MVEGLDTAWEINKNGGRIIFFDMDMSLYTRLSFPSVLLNHILLWLVLYGCCQASVQRISSVSSLGKARLTLFLSVPMWVTCAIISSLCGLIAYAYYEIKGCDPYASKIIRNKNQLLLQLVADILNYPCMCGLFLSAVVCGCLSNISSSLSALSANIWDDILQHRFKDLPENRKAFANKIIGKHSNLKDQEEKEIFSSLFIQYIIIIFSLSF